MAITFGHCRHCSKEIVYEHDRPLKFCSVACYRLSEQVGKLGNGSVSRSKNYGVRKLHAAKSGDPMLC